MTAWLPPSARSTAVVTESDDAGIRDEASGFAAGIEAVAGELYQLRNQSPKDKIAFPIKLNDRLTGLRSHLERGDGTPIDAYQAVFDELSAELDVHLRTLERMLSEDLPRLNRRLVEAGLTSWVRGALLIAAGERQSLPGSASSLGSSTVHPCVRRDSSARCASAASASGNRCPTVSRMRPA